MAAGISNFGGQQLENYQIYTDVNALNDLKQKARHSQKDALRPVAQQFEALFVQQILKQSRNVKLDDGWLDGQHMDSYKSMHDDQLAQSITAKGTLGLADIIVEELTPDHPVMSAEAYKAMLEEQKSKQKQENTSEMPTTAHNLALREL